MKPTERELERAFMFLFEFMKDHKREIDGPYIQIDSNGIEIINMSGEVIFKSPDIIEAAKLLTKISG